MFLPYRTSATGCILMCRIQRRRQRITNSIFERRPSPLIGTSSIVLSSSFQRLCASLPRFVPKWTSEWMACSLSIENISETRHIRKHIRATRNKRKKLNGRNDAVFANCKHIVERRSPPFLRALRFLQYQFINSDRPTFVLLAMRQNVWHVLLDLRIITTSIAILHVPSSSQSSWSSHNVVSDTRVRRITPLASTP